MHVKMIGVQNFLKKITGLLVREVLPLCVCVRERERERERERKGEYGNGKMT